MIVRAGLLVASVVLRAACDPSGPPGPTTSAVPSGKAGPTSPTTGQGTSVPPGDESAFPIVVTRVGGIAGFNDRVTVQASGTTTVRTKRGAAASCTLTDAAVARLAAAAVTLSSAVPMTSDPRISDDLVTSLQSPLTQGPVRVGDAASESLAVVRELLADVTGDPPAHALCR